MAGPAAASAFRLKISSSRETASTWALPQPLWDAYGQESLSPSVHRRLPRSPEISTTACESLRRRRQAQIWPAEAALTASHASAAPISGFCRSAPTPSSQVVPDQAAVGAMGGIPFLATFWGDLLMALWRSLPESDPSRQVLVRFSPSGLPERDRADPGCDAEAMAFCRADGTHASGPITRSSCRDRHQYDHAGDFARRTSAAARHSLKIWSPFWISPPTRSGEGHEQRTARGRRDKRDIGPNGQVNQGAAGTCSPTSIRDIAHHHQSVGVRPASDRMAKLRGEECVGQLRNCRVPVGVLKSPTLPRSPPPAF